MDNYKPQNTGKNLNEALQEASFFLSQKNWDGSLARNYWMYLFDWDLNQLVKNLNRPLTEEESSVYQDALERIIRFEPIQYISGFGYFMDEKFKVSPATLIPREETAGLIEACYPFLKENSKARVLDIGTGTGIIAIQLKKSFPELDIWASDISPEALEIAKENAALHGVEIKFVESDVFDSIPTQMKFDLIVSNPPYIGEHETDLVDKSVSDYEPALALWADDEGLAVYNRMIKDLKKYLNEKGLVAFEIGFQQGAAVKHLIENYYPAANVFVEKDFNQLDRYVLATLGESR